MCEVRGMKITRERFAIMRDNRTEIWCGIAEGAVFRPVEDLGLIAVRTYMTEGKARAACWCLDEDCEIVPVRETFEIE